MHEVRVESYKTVPTPGGGGSVVWPARRSTI
jgi:hypothetical protein